MRQSNFFSFEEVGPSEDRGALIEIETKWKTTRANLPVQLSAEILGASKMVLLDYYYNFFQHYLRKTSFCLSFCDTDSLALALSQPSLEDCVKPELKQDFEQNKIKYLAPTTSDPEFIQHYSKTPLLLKSEKEADFCCSLQPKLYTMINLDGSRKMAHKGIQNSPENEKILELRTYLDSLYDMDGVDKVAIHRGIRTQEEGFLVTYKQERTALSHLQQKFCYCSSKLHNFPIEVYNGDPEVFKKLYPYECEALSYNDIWNYISQLGNEHSDCKILLKHLGISL